ncbi:Holliday junction resolvase RecU [Aquibacillus sp. 3ASR75-11]|uniref:Holliday junction resolvase RecU n=1 Tax=Terrihalobacillus insolitus TaxID=2950438 RepID=A0A9X3WUB5_9BACI|nr:Holliday junction resolvase RecU [Terrihalobacillus insolitus]MDC3413016.1 Holliday junction resolvase RecU [Terrihalobacillus insolitus]MDC3424758.1 Holliday junction resolvase RecU [Terrihalobacillus insolitus]
MNYPNGSKQIPRSSQKLNSNETIFSNRGMTLEEDINATNDYYLDACLAVIHKKPTPVQIVKVDYPKRSAAVIKEGYFKQASTTDYNGVYRGKYVDFEAKETKNKTSFPLSNIHQHQVNHMKAVINQGGICFLIIRFAAFDETYLFQAHHLFEHWDNQFKGARKSIKYEQIRENGYFIPFAYQARVNYLSIVDQVYF